MQSAGVCYTEAEPEQDEESKGREGGGERAHAVFLWIIFHSVRAAHAARWRRSSE